MNPKPIPLAEMPLEKVVALTAAETPSITKEIEAELAKLDDAPSRVRIPMHVFLSESDTVARFLVLRWKPSTDPASGAPVPGIVSAGEKKLPERTAKKISVLLSMIGEETATIVRLSQSTQLPQMLKRAAFIEDETERALEFLFDDGVEDERDEQLDALQALPAEDSGSAAAVAERLSQTCRLGNRYRGELNGLGGYDVSLLDEGMELSDRLRALPKLNLGGNTQTHHKRRQKLLRLLDVEVRRARAAARFVYRRHPAIVREVTSAWERAKRTEVRRRQLAAQQEAPPQDQQGEMTQQDQQPQQTQQSA